MRNQYDLVIDLQKFGIGKNLEPRCFGELIAQKKITVAMHEIQCRTGRFCALNSLDNALAGAVAVVVAVPNLEQVAEQKDKCVFLGYANQPILEGVQCFGGVF